MAVVFTGVLFALVICVTAYPGKNDDSLPHGLAGGTAPVVEVACQVGYGNPANYSTSFSHHFGYAPSETQHQVPVFKQCRLI